MKQFVVWFRVKETGERARVSINYNPQKNEQYHIQRAKMIAEKEHGKGLRLIRWKI